MFLQSKEEKSGDDDDDIADKTKKDSLISCCIEALGKSWPSNQATQGNNGKRKSFCWERGV